MADMRSDRSALGQLWDILKDANGLTYRSVEERAKQHGQVITKSVVQKLVNQNPLQAQVSRDNILGLAAGMSTTPERVALAVVQSMGFRIADSGITTAEAIRRDVYLGEETREALLAILRSAERRRGA